MSLAEFLDAGICLKIVTVDVFRTKQNTGIYYERIVVDWTYDSK